MSPPLMKVWAWWPPPACPVLPRPISPSPLLEPSLAAFVTAVSAAASLSVAHRLLAAVLAAAGTIVIA